MPSRFGLMLLTAVILTLGYRTMAFVKKDETDLEESVCGSLREPLAFWSFRRMAGTARPDRLSSLRDIERLSFITRDGRRLGGYKLRAAAPWGYLLVAQGNAMLVDQIASELQFFRTLGLDLYLYDYRGYGLSEGKSRLKALISDYQEIVAALNTQGYRRRLLYGISMGGIILLDAVGAEGDYDAAVIDSSPSRISPLGCPEHYDPVNHLPLDASRIMIIAGARDHVVSPGEMKELIAQAQDRGAQVRLDPEFAHPFQDSAYAIHRRRFQAVADFLAQWRP
jgi:alpha-beta hydrolase superfamily lysophospholipase